jgi:hypothetical protein
MILGYFRKITPTILITVFLLGGFSFQLEAQQAIFINEFMSANQNFLRDEDGDDADWIELYNASSQTQSLLGYSLSDRSNNLNLWDLPDTTLGPGEFLLVFASGKNRRVAGQPLHTNFSIAASGEFIYLSNQSQLIQSLPPVALEANQSAGLIPDGGTNYWRMAVPSPAAPNNAFPLAEVVYFSSPGGFYEKGFWLTLAPSVSHLQIRYTINGNQPDFLDLEYSGALLLNQELLTESNLHTIVVSDEKKHQPDFLRRCIVLRAALFNAEGQRMSRTFTQTYLLGEFGNRHALPVVSLSADSLALFSFDSGIFVPGVSAKIQPGSANYFQTGLAWERLCNVEYIEQGAIKINQQAGLRLHGNTTRIFSQKGLRLYARSEYGPSKFSHAFFTEKSMQAVDRLALKPFRAAWNEAGFLDQWSNYAAHGLNFEWPGSRAVVLYLNGTYWGIYYLQERIDDRYLINNFPTLHRDSVEVVERWWGEGTKGLSFDFIGLVNFILANDLTLAANYKTVENWIDIASFIDYQLFQIIIANRDWPDNNIKCWRETKAGGKWRWIFHDGDGAVKIVGHESLQNAISTASEGPGNVRSTALFRALLRNPDFRLAFLKRADELLIQHFSPENTYALTNRVANEVVSEVPHQIQRFGWPESLENWFKEVDNTHAFAARRPCEVKKQIATAFGHQVPLHAPCKPPQVPVLITKIAPNPNNGSFQLHFESTSSSRCELEIYDLSGRCFYRAYLFAEQGSNLADLEVRLENGIYLLQLSTHYHTDAQKLVIAP